MTTADDAGTPVAPPLPSDPPGYPASLASDVLLTDGGTVHVRPIRPDDGPALVAFHSTLSADTIYLRFFSPKPVLTQRDVERFTCVDYVDRMAFVAVLGDAFIGVARYDRVPGTTEAEVAFVVVDDHQGRGIGTILLEFLAVHAREHGVTRFIADTLPQNRRMLEVFHTAGFAEERHFEDGVVRVSFPIEPTEASLEAIHERERRATTRSMRTLLAPRSIAVVGAGRSRGTIGHEVFRNLLNGGFNGPVYPVHPTASHVLSVRAYPRIVDVPDDVDMAVIVVPAEKVPGIVEECAEKRVRGLVVISAGFAETGADGLATERAFVEHARRFGMRVVGPNCMGVVNTVPSVSMNATFAPVPPVRGRVGFSTQSGALGITVLEESSALGLGVSTFVSIGNKADVSTNDLLQYWEEDPDTDVILLYVESFGNPRTFSRVARRLSRVKPIVAVKGGRGTAGRRGASSHTAALASSETGVEALFRQTGVIRVDTLGDMFDVAQVLVHQPLPRGPRIGIVGNAGGPGILAADACEAAGLQVPELSEQTQAALRAIAVSAAAVGNPVDMTAGASADDYEHALRIVLADPGIDAVICIFIPPLVTQADDVAAAIARAAAFAGDKPILANFLATKGVPAALRSSTVSIPSFTFPEAAARALAAVQQYAVWRQRPPGEVPHLDGVDQEAARAIVDAALTEHPGGLWLPGDSAIDLLDAYSIPVARTLHATGEDEAVAAAGRVGYPVALKAASGDIVHKTDVGGVQLNLGDADAVRRAYRRMHEALGDTMGGAIVQPMVPPGVETIVGVVLDPSFGPLVMFGTGGTAVELLGDHAFRILPLTDVDARELVRSTRGSPLLFGYRGAPAADVASLEKLLLRVGRLVDDVPEIAEMDLNPVIAAPSGAVAVDAKVRLAPWVPRPELALRRLTRE